MISVTLKKKIFETSNQYVYFIYKLFSSNTVTNDLLILLKWSGLCKLQKLGICLREVSVRILKYEVTTENYSHFLIMLFLCCFIDYYIKKEKKYWFPGHYWFLWNQKRQRTYRMMPYSFHSMKTFGYRLYF